jgi:hypothetical protein
MQMWGVLRFYACAVAHRAGHTLKYHGKIYHQMPRLDFLLLFGYKASYIKE